MKLKKIAAFIIAVSMTVGLLSVFPASALTPVTGYAEEITVNESFDGSYSEDWFVIKNGSVADDKAKLVVGEGGSLSMKPEINTTDKKQIIAEFDINADITYTDPWSAAYIGMSLMQMGATPDSAVNGSWVGITNEKLILWHSTSEGGYTWGNTKNNGALIVDNTFGSKNISVRIIYEGTNAELYIRNNDATPAEGATEPAYVLAASLSAPSQKVATLTSGTEKLDSAITFPEKYSERYFAISTSTAAKDESGWEFGGEGATTGGSTPATPAEPEFILVDNFVVKAYSELLMSEAEKTALTATKTTLENIVAKYGTDERLYLDASVDVDALNTFVGEIDALLANAGALSSEYTALNTAINTALGAAVSLTYVTSYNTSLDNYEAVLNSADLTIYSEADINAAKEKITDARALLNETALTKATLENALTEIGNTVGAIGICTLEGIPTYSASFTDPGYTYNDFISSWSVDGNSESGVQVSGEEGALIKMDWNGSRRYRMQYKQSFSNYSVKATLTKIANGMSTMGIRQTLGANTFESDGGSPTLVGGDNAVFIATEGSGNMKNVHIGVRAMRRDGNNNVLELHRAIYSYSLGSIPDAVFNNDLSATFLIKDMDDMIEFYVVAGSTNVRLATIYFNPQKVSDKYTSGLLINDVTGESQEFSNVSIPAPADSVIGFSGRNGRYGIRDFQINTNVLPDSPDKYVADPTLKPTSFYFAFDGTDENFTAIAEEKNFSFDALYSRVKIYGRDAYVQNKNVSVLADSAASVKAAAGDSIIKIDAASAKATAVKRGTDVITVSYGDEFKTSRLVSVNAPYTAPTDTFASRVVEASIANSQAFKCLNMGDIVIPVVSYKLPNGTGDILADNYKVNFSSEDEDIIKFDATTGAFVAGTKTGVTDIYAEIPYGTSGESKRSAKVTVEVVAADATPGASYTGSLNEIVVNANDTVSNEEYANIFEDASASGFDVDLGKTDEDKAINAGLVKEAVTEAVAEGTIDPDDIDEAALQTAIDDALNVRKVYDILVDEEGTADEIGAVVFSSENPFGIDFTSYYEDLTDVQRDTVIVRTHTQLKRKDASKLTKSEIVKTVETIITAVKDGGAISGGGGGGKVTTNNKADKGGSFSASSITTSTKPNTVTKPLLTGDAAISQAERFADINDAAWAKEAIGALAYEGVVAGYEDGSILPNKEITRDEFVKLLVTALGIDMTDVSGVAFSDIESGSWQEAYIAAAVKAGIVNGTGALTFGSGQTISRQDMATMIYRAIVTLKFNLPSDKSVAFRDAEMVAGYALEAVNKLAASGVISGMGDGIFAPGARATRAQAICMIFNLRSLMK